MSMTSLGGVLGSAAGAPLSQTVGSETERAHRDSAVEQRRTDSQQQAERAAGIGQTSEDQESSERDADGRRPWELSSGGKNTAAEQQEDKAAARQSKDATGQSGNRLDLVG